MAPLVDTPGSDEEAQGQKYMGRPEDIPVPPEDVEAHRDLDETADEGASRLLMTRRSSFHSTS